MAARVRFSTAGDPASGLARMPAAQGGDLRRAIVAWALLLSAMVVLPSSPALVAASADALGRLPAAAASLLHRTAATTTTATLPQAAAPLAAPMAGGATTTTTKAAAAQPATGNAPAAAQPATGNAPAAAQPVTVPGAIAPSIAQPPTVQQPTTNAPASAPQPVAGLPVVAPPVTVPVVAPVVAQPAPTTAPVAAPTAPPSVALSGVAVAAPIAPTAYTVPAGALRVTNSAELISALGRSTPTDIVLADGTYDNGSPFVNGGGHHLYAARLGGATLTAGMSVGGNFGPGKAVIQGLSFNVSSAAKTMGLGIIQVWGNASGTRILDSTFNGNSAIGAGVFISSPNGVVVSRVQVRNFTSYGVYADTNSANRLLATPVILEDLDVSGVSRAAPRSSNGTAEACVWLGNNGIVRRAKLRDCAWMGLWTGGGNTGAIHENLDIDNTPTGLYMEHFTTGSLFQHIRIGTNVTIGLVCEWDDPAWGGKPGCVDVTIQDSTIMSSEWGAFLDEGTTRTTIQRVKFIGQSKAAIYNAPRGIDNTFTDNDYSQIDATAVPITRNR